MLQSSVESIKIGIEWKHIQFYIYWGSQLDRHIYIFRFQVFKRVMVGKLICPQSFLRISDPQYLYMKQIEMHLPVHTHCPPSLRGCGGCSGWITCPSLQIIWRQAGLREEEHDGAQNGLYMYYIYYILVTNIICYNTYIFILQYIDLYSYCSNY